MSLVIDPKRRAIVAVLPLTLSALAVGCVLVALACAPRPTTGHPPDFEVHPVDSGVPPPGTVPVLTQDAGEILPGVLPCMPSICDVARATFLHERPVACGEDAGPCPFGTLCGDAGACVVPTCSSCDGVIDIPGYACDVDAGARVPLACATDAQCDDRGRARCVDGCCVPDLDNPMLFPFTTPVCEERVRDGACAEPCWGGCDLQACGCAPHAEDAGCAVAYHCWQIDDDTPQGLGVCEPQHCGAPSFACGAGAVCNWPEGLCMPLVCDDADDCDGAPCVDGCCSR